eukprot:3662054-Pyramimonas_sp.AAC.1
MGMPPMGSLGSSRGGCAVPMSFHGAPQICARAGSPLGDLVARLSPPLASPHTGRWRPLPPLARRRLRSPLAALMF